jgi:acetyl/propionyl-CoA carboxylase alpha subunit
MAMTFTLTVDGRTETVEVVVEGEQARVRVGERWYTTEFERINQAGLYSLLIDGRSYEIYARERTGGIEVLLGNRVYEIESGKRRAEEAAAVTGAWTLVSPMSGQIVEVRAAAGAEVAAGDVLVVIESMKMNNELTAARPGTIAEVLVSAGDRVEKGRTLVRVE